MSIQDKRNLYLMMEYVNGMELWQVIRCIGYLNNDQARFYIASMILGLEYMHNEGIIYRDIKPENIMVDRRGFIKFIDLGTAKFMKKKSHYIKSSTIIGTPHYMAPEVIEGRGYSYTADLWSLGICLYEFMVGRVPFAQDSEEPFEIYSEIKNTEIGFPKFFVKPENAEAIQFIRQLLSRVPESRMTGLNYSALKLNKWLRNVEWDLLIEKLVTPPFVPPEEKIVSQSEIEEMALKNIPITSVSYLFPFSYFWFRLWSLLRKST